MNLPDLFAPSLKQAADAPGLEFNGEVFSFGRLDELWPLGLLLSYIKIQKYIAAIYLLLFSFAIYFSIYHY
jgi:hypothetical protein